MSSARCFRRRVFRVVWGFHKGHRYLLSSRWNLPLTSKLSRFLPRNFFLPNILFLQRRRREKRSVIFLFPICNTILAVSNSRYVSSIEAYRNWNWSVRLLEKPLSFRNDGRKGIDKREKKKKKKKEKKKRSFSFDDGDSLLLVLSSMAAIKPRDR